MSDINTVTKFYELELAALGYGDCEPQWSLNYCQGDGMAFYGFADVAKLADRLLKGATKAAAKRAAAKGASIEIERRGYHYNHWNTMSVSLYAADYHCDELTNREAEAFEELGRLVSDDVKEVSRRLEHDGYALLEAHQPGSWYARNTAHDVDEDGSVRTDWHRFSDDVVVVTYLDNEPDYNAYESGDEAADHESVKRMIAGEYGVCSVRVVVLDEETNEELGFASCGWVTDDKAGAHIKEIAKELRDEAIEQARGRIERLGSIFS